MNILIKTVTKNEKNLNIEFNDCKIDFNEFINVIAKGFSKEPYTFFIAHRGIIITPKRYHNIGIWSGDYPNLFLIDVSSIFVHHLDTLIQEYKLLQNEEPHNNEKYSNIINIINDVLKSDLTK